MTVIALEAVRLAAARRVIEDEIERLIALLDALDAAAEDREPDEEDEVISEDDGVVIGWRPVGRQA
jgi:DNA-binding GntR family transcriptional regulator